MSVSNLSTTLQIKDRPKIDQISPLAAVALIIKTLFLKKMFFSTFKTWDFSATQNFSATQKWGCKTRVRLKVGGQKSEIRGKYK